MSVIKNMLVVLFSLFIFAACTEGNKPSASVIEEAVTLEMQNKGVPERWVKAMIKGYKPNFDTIKVTEWGKYNNERRRWSVKVRVAGTATLNIPFARQPEIRKFNEVGEFYFYKDDYDKWQSKFNRPGIFGENLSFKEKEEKAKAILDRIRSGKY